MNKDINKDSFVFVQSADKISDEKFSTKPIGYLQDAFIRFRRNKVNLVATFILLTLMLLSFLVPAVSTKNHTEIDTYASNLPSRIPFLEKFGIFDGSIKRKAAVIDLDTNLPAGIKENAIKPNSLVTYKIDCNTDHKACIDGQMLVGDFVYLPYVAQYDTRIVEVPQDEKEELEERGAIIREIEKVGCVTVAGVEYCNYKLEIDTVKAQGLKGIPYFWFGTNSQGHDMFTKLFSGVKISLLIGLLASVINITIGIIYGAIAGYYGGRTDLLLSRITEVLGGIPFIAILTVATLYFGSGLLTVILAVCLTGWIGVASVTRTQFYRYKGREYVLASRTLGASDRRLIFRHILPNGIGTLVTTSILMIPGMIGLESMLSYLNLGLNTTPSIGVIMANGQAAGLKEFPWLTLYPAVIISLLMITFNMFGLALRDALNPSLRGS